MPFRLATIFKNTDLLLLGICLICGSLLLAQSNVEERLSRNQKLLRELETQIQELRQKIISTQKKESDLATQIRLLNQEMALLARSKGVLEQELKLLQQKVANTEEKLQTTNRQLEQLKKLYAARAVYAYKYGRVKNVELLLGSGSINQALVRLKYLQQVARHDENLLRSINRKKQKIEALKQELERDLAQKKQALQMLEQKKQQYLARKSEKQKLLNRLKRTHSNYEQLLSRKDQERRHLLSIIAALEKQRLARQKNPEQAAKETFKFKNFSKARGKLPWPVKGKVVSHFGKHRDPVSRTYTKNTDIEIKAQPGTPVRCVFPGVVRVIQFLPGYGNLIIVDHGNGYYSLYSHLGEIFVYWDMPVEQNQIIAKVGDSGYNGPVTLRFGIYSANKIHDPERWLE